LFFGREVDQLIYYNNIEVGTRRADFVVENQVIVELKALIDLEACIWHRLKITLSHTIFRWVYLLTLVLLDCR